MMVLAKYAVLITMVSLLNLSCFAIDPPVIRCVSLDDDGNLTLTWSPPVDSNGTFENYVIYYDGVGGVFSQLQIVPNYSQTSFELIGNYAGTVSFYMVSTADGGVSKSLPSDTVSPIILNLFADGNKIEIQWSELGLPSADSTYQLFRQVDSGPWVSIGSSEYNERSFSDEIERCEAYIRYRVEISGVGGCVSRSNAASIFVIDETPPEQCNLICASVDTATGFVDLAWESTVSVDGFGYLITYFADDIGVDTSFGKNNLTYQYSQSGINAQLKPETLSVAPFDSCFDTIVMWYNQAADSLRFSTIYVDSVGFDRCAGKIGLQWNMPTDGFPVGLEEVDEYRVYRRENNGGSDFRGFVSGADSVFVDSGLVKGASYEYVVTAFNKALAKEAMSNVFRFKVKPPDAPDFLYAAAIKNNHETDLNAIAVYTDTTSETTKYVLERALSAFDDYQIVNQTTKINRPEFDMVDLTGKAVQTDYHYRIVAYDYCDAPIYKSESAKSIWINGYKRERDYINDMSWTEYAGYEHANSLVENYQLVRLTNESQRDTIRVQRLFQEFTDTIFELEYIGGEVCYYVEAIEQAENAFGLSKVSSSNKFCVNYEPRIFVPNAFTPDGDGINDRFLPDVNFVDVDGYKLSIYDRAGNLVHIATDPTEGWGGVNQSSGVYAFFLQMNNSRGEAVNFTGKVVLLR